MFSIKRLNWNAKIKRYQSYVSLTGFGLALFLFGYAMFYAAGDIFTARPPLYFHLTDKFMIYVLSSLVLCLVLTIVHTKNVIQSVMSNLLLTVLFFSTSLFFTNLIYSPQHLLTLLSKTSRYQETLWLNDATQASLNDLLAHYQETFLVERQVEWQGKSVDLRAQSMSTHPPATYLLWSLCTTIHFFVMPHMT